MSRAWIWEPYSVPYIVLPDGTTEVDLHVDQHVSYLLDDGDTVIHESNVSMPCAASQSEIFDLDDETLSVCSNLHLKADQIYDLFDSF